MTPERHVAISEALDYALGMLIEKLEEIHSAGPLSDERLPLLLAMVDRLNAVERNRGQLVMAALNRRGKDSLPKAALERMINTLVGAAPQSVAGA